MALDHAAVRGWVESSCARQGLPVVVTDPAIVARVGALLTGRGAARTAAERRSTAPARSKPPSRNDAGGVEAAG